MLNITTITRQRVDKVVDYYADGADDYYAKDGNAMQWQGAGAEELGLTGEVEQKRFAKLLDGKVTDDISVMRKTANSESKERLGYDLTFSAPKGVTLQALVNGDKRIIEAHDRAVTKAIEEAERLALGRFTVNKKTHVENTNKLIVGKFRHETSRELDPDLHTHAFVMNLTKTSDGKWRSLTNDGIVNSLTLLGNVYKSELARELELAGYNLRYDRNGTFDLAHFSQEQIAQFSQRSQQIEAELAKNGLSRETASHEQKNAAALKTRKSKGEVDRDVLYEGWKNRAKELQIDFDSREWKGAANDDIARNTQPAALEKPIEYQADKVMTFAIRSLTERQSVITERELMDVAMKHGYGRLTLDDIRAARERAITSGNLIKEEATYAAATTNKKQQNVAMTREQWVTELVKAGRNKDEARKLVDKGITNGRLVQQKPRFTTQLAQQRERNILKMEREGRGKIQTPYTREFSEGWLASRTLKPEQLKAVMGIIHTPNQFISVHGFAGTGKSYMTKSAADFLKEQGVHVTSLAPYGSQVKALQAEGLESRTLQSFLRASDKKIGPGSVVFIDEAGVIPARQMEETMRVIRDAGARAVFVGDTKQTKAVEAGKPFEQLIKAGMETAYMKDIQRQKDPELLKAALNAAEGKIKASLTHVTSIVEEKNHDQRYRRIVGDYVAMPPTDRANALIITGTNDSRKKINAYIQAELGLKGQGINYPLLNRLDTTQAQRQHSKYYEKGAVIIPERDYSNGLKRGAVYTVLDTGPGNKLTVSDGSGDTIAFSPARFSKLSVYSVEKTELAVGDQVRITRNDAHLDLANGDRFKVKGVQSGEVLLENEKGRLVKIDANKPMYLGLAYASTVHSAQGLTCDKVFINMDTRSLTTAKDVYYVAVTRAKHEAVIYTDDEKKLDKAASREGFKTAALELEQLKRYAKEQQHDAREKGRDKTEPTQEKDNAKRKGKGHDKNNDERAFTSL
ncbi:conjugative relaxase [Salmonella enterica subsp. enterica serovar Agona]|nr:conjugative relaxase [Salmonella enterica subsp. enterica serovar Agona]EEY6104055.1 conjugative relaxase [Salmonella enterica subsp. enterica serovar Agona]